MNSDPFIIISSDGHGGALMEDYRPYIDPEFLDDFDAFVPLWNEHGARNFDPLTLQKRLDPEYLDEWTAKMFETGRIDAFPSSSRRLQEVEKEGISAEVLFPDFGLPFELGDPAHVASMRDYEPPDHAHREAAFRAFNRWLADYVSVAPERFAGMGIVSWDDVDKAVAEIRKVHAIGLKGIVLSHFSPDLPLYHDHFEPIWQEIELLGLVTNVHPGLSSTTTYDKFPPGAPHQALAYRLRAPVASFFHQNVLSDLMWGGVFERHPKITFVFTELGSGWIQPLLEGMDYSYEGSYFRTDYKDILPSKPSEYFSRQCFIGSSIFSRAEVEARHSIGLNKMMLGMDCPHHEGTLLHTTQEYIRATVGAAQVPEDEARRLLGETAASVFGFDLKRLAPVAERIGPRPSEVLTPPETDLYNGRGDVHKPLSKSGV